MSIFEYLKVPDIILSLFLHQYWTGLTLLAPTVFLLVISPYFFMLYHHVFSCHHHSSFVKFLFEIDLYCYTTIFLN